MKQILSVGKSIKIVRNLERSNIVQTTIFNEKDTMDHGGFDYEALSNQNVKQYTLTKSNLGFNFQNQNSDMASFNIETIAQNFINSEKFHGGYKTLIDEGNVVDLRNAPFQWSF